MKVIDLLNKIANGEEVNSFLYCDGEFKKGCDGQYYMFDGMRFAFEDLSMLNDEVEILDEEDEFIDIEELKIGHPEDNPSNKYIINEYGTKCFLTKHSRIMAEKINEVIKNQKLIIQALKENK